MRRALLSVAALALLAPGAGCTTCASPYDYCGPTFSGECGDGCDFHARRGSVFAPADIAVTTGEVMVSEPAAEMYGEPTPAPAVEPISYQRRLPDTGGRYVR